MYQNELKERIDLEAKQRANQNSQGVSARSLNKLRIEIFRKLLIRSVRFDDLFYDCVPHCCSRTP